ncbi:Sas10 C-terminal domain [Dillenia turbinata]|uniref:Sas10 C-terminal domain n=1 Tax=Dillenia turbinata TaxID=194707 RepID=A0AAN8VMN5_9MAGN
MAKGGRNRKKDNKIPKRRRQDEDDVLPEDMDDEIDAFHKQRDKISLDVGDDIEESDEDAEQPVFAYKGIDDEEDDEDENEDDDDDDDDDMDDSQLTGLAAKIARQQKFLRAKVGGVEDEMEEDTKDDEEKKAGWGPKKSFYYSADNVDFELQSSDEEEPAEEEAEVLRLQKERAKALSMEDYGIDDASLGESDREPTLEELKVKGKTTSKSLEDEEAKGDTAYEVVKKDLDSLSKEEQMDVIKEVQSTTKGGMHYMEVKQLLLLVYCQAIAFYLLLKSEGHPVRDHPVIARLVEIKNLLDKVKELDINLPSELEEILNITHASESGANIVQENVVALAPDSFGNNHRPTIIATELQEAAVNTGAWLESLNTTEDHVNRVAKRKRQDDQLGLQSVEMLKVRAALEEKLRQKGVLNTAPSKSDKMRKKSHTLKGKLESFDDFDDDTADTERGSHALKKGPPKLSQLLSSKVTKPKAVSGDDDIPKRDDIGERRRKHELRVLAGAGVKTMGDAEDEHDIPLADQDAGTEDGTEESEDEFYEEVKAQRAAKLAAKAEIYTRASKVPSLPETVVDGKRQITYEMEKNRGLTRARKKLTKNPRKKYKLKHQKAVSRRKGQVREIRRPGGSYGGETSGINTKISRSIRFKS